MNVLTELRNELATAVTTLIPGSTHLGKNPKFPQAIILPGEPYIRRDDSGFCPSYVVTANINVISGDSDNRIATVDVDEYICNVLETLPDAWNLVSISQPGIVEIAGKEYLGAIIEVSKNDVTLN